MFPAIHISKAGIDAINVPSQPHDLGHGDASAHPIINSCDRLPQLGPRLVIVRPDHRARLP
jgi:hypothetical protein